jgi:glycosyltransferase involved in cell wall biosynthesis
MVAGLPIVATNTGGIPEIVQNGVNGLLVPTRNAPALAKAISGLLEKPELRKKMGQASLDIVQNFSTDKMIQGNIAVYSNLADRVSD